MTVISWSNQGLVNYLFDYKNHQDTVELGLPKGHEKREQLRGTTLQHAISGNRPVEEIAEIIARVPKWVNPINMHEKYLGVTPLIAAVLMDNKEVVELLIEHGADLFAKDAKGFKALDHAYVLNNSTCKVLIGKIKAIGSKASVRKNSKLLRSNPKLFYREWNSKDTRQENQQNTGKV